MKLKHIIYSIALMALVTACNQQPSREEALNELRTADSTFTSNANKMAINPAEASHMIALYTQFVNRFPDDTLAPLCLLKAGDIASQTDNTDTSLMLYNRAISDYGDYAYIAEVYFNKAWMLETAQRYDEAREAFQQFLDLFPEHPMARDVRFQLESNLIGLSPEEQLNAILSNNE